MQQGCWKKNRLKILRRNKRSLLALLHELFSASGKYETLNSTSQLQFWKESNQTSTQLVSNLPTGRETCVLQRL